MSNQSIRRRLAGALAAVLLLAMLGPVTSARAAASGDAAFLAAVTAGLAKRWQGSQAIVVRADSENGPGATMWLMEKTAGKWRVAAGPWRANVGKNGVSKAAEGDGRSPSGAFLLGTAFGWAAAPQYVKWPYRRTDSMDRWVDDGKSPYYNRWVRGSVSATGSGEALKSISVYKYALAVHYNDEGIKGKGSAIFLHIWRGLGVGTLGCTSMSEANLVKTLRWLRYERRPVLVQGTQKQILSLMGRTWGIACLPQGWGYVDDFIPDAQADLRYATSNNFTGTKLPGYGAPVMVMRTDAIAALSRAAGKLRTKGYGIRVLDAYRPPQAVAAMVAWAKNADQSTKARYYPNISKSSLLNGYISATSSHTAGGTVDLSVISWSTGRFIDMGGTFDFFGSRSHYSYSGLTAKQAANRKLLRDAMSSAGFTPYSKEWWHFSRAATGKGSFTLLPRQTLAK